MGSGYTPEGTRNRAMYPFLSRLTLTSTLWRYFVVNFCIPARITALVPQCLRIFPLIWRVVFLSCKNRSPICLRTLQHSIFPQASTRTRCTTSCLRRPTSARIRCGTLLVGLSLAPIVDTVSNHRMRMSLLPGHFLLAVLTIRICGCRTRRASRTCQARI